jgi:hypothetical protein
MSANLIPEAALAHFREFSRLSGLNDPNNFPFKRNPQGAFDERLSSRHKELNAALAKVGLEMFMAADGSFVMGDAAPPPAGKVDPFRDQLEERQGMATQAARKVTDRNSRYASAKDMDPYDPEEMEGEREQKRFPFSEDEFRPYCRDERGMEDDRIDRLCDILFRGVARLKRKASITAR